MKLKKINFVAEKQGKSIYIQVAYLLIDKKHRIGSLEICSKSKFVISMDDADLFYKGIIHLNIKDFLLNSW